MMAWLADNAATILTIAAVLIPVGIAVFSLARDKKRRSGGCTGNCAACGRCCYGKKRS